MAKKYYVRKIEKRRSSSSAWFEVVADSEPQAAAIFVRSMNKRLRERYDLKKDPWAKSYLLSQKDVSVRASRPTRGDIYSLEKESKDVYVAGNVKRPSVKNKMVKTLDLPTKQYEILCGLSAKCGMPLAYSDDLHKHDKSSLKIMKPKRFYWVVRENGTSLVVLDHGGKKLSKKEYGWELGKLKHHLREYQNGSKRDIYLIDGTKVVKEDFKYAYIKLYELSGLPPEEMWSYLKKW